METSVQADLPGGSSWQPVMDEYVWLAGRPVLSIRSTFSKSLSNPPTWSAAPDWTASCARRSVAGTCRPNAIVSDAIGKPVATFDSSRNIAGVLEYDPYGAVNRVEHWGEIAPHQNSGCWWVASWMKQGTGPLTREVRAVLPRVDIPNYTGSGGGCIGQYKSNPYQNPYGAPAGSDTCGPKTDFKFGWTTLADAEGLHVLYCSYDNNISPQPAGVTVRGYDYKKYEAGAVHYMPPFRFPGQYFDEETGFHENWNRYYEPLTGRYLSPEPLLQNPRKVADDAQSGYLTATYAYARNNPISVSDPDGNWPWEIRTQRTGKLWYWGHDGSTAAGGACNCHVRIDTRPGSQTCWISSASATGHSLHPPDGDTCPFGDRPTPCKDYCYNEASAAFGTGLLPSSTLGWNQETCFLPPWDRATQFLGTTP